MSERAHVYLCQSEITFRKLFFPRKTLSFSQWQWRPRASCDSPTTRVRYLNKRHLENRGVILRGQMDWRALAPSAIMLKEWCKDQLVTCLIINLDNSCQCHFKIMLILFYYHIRYTRSVILWASVRGIRYILQNWSSMCEVLFVTIALYVQKRN